MENGGLNLYGFLAGNPISHVDFLGLAFRDDGEKFIFGGMDKGDTYSKLEELKIGYSCARCSCVFTLDKFLVTTRTTIVVYSVWDINQPPPYKPYTAAEINRNSVHEAKHRRHAGQWHDAALQGIQTDLSNGYKYSCGRCGERKAEIEKKWRDSWSEQQQAEIEHSGSDWTVADRTRTDGEVNQDPNSWRTTLPVDSLKDEIANPYGN